MPPKGKSKTRSHPYEPKSPTKRSSRRIEKTVDTQIPSTSQDNEMPSTSQDMQIPSTSQSSRQSQNNSIDNVSRKEFLNLKSNVDKILQSLNQLQSSVSFPPGKTGNVTMPSETPVDINVSQQVDQSEIDIDNETEVRDIDTQVQDAVTEGLESIIGTCHDNLSSFILPGRPVDMKISNKLKQQIWANEYIDFNLLLDFKQEEVSSYQIISKEGGPISLAPNKTTKTIGSLGQWCTAFMVYLTVYCKKFPNQLSDLTSYLSSIKLLCHRGGDYLTYDREFRLLRQSNNMPFSIVHSQLWLECRDANHKNKNQSTQGKQKSSFRAQANTSNKNTHPFGTCFKYHDTGKCSKGASCLFTHTCYNEGCGGKHPIFRCFKNQNGNKPNAKSFTESKPSNANSNKTT